MAVNAAEIILKVRNQQMKQELEEAKDSLNKFRDEQTSRFKAMAASVIGYFSIQSAFSMGRQFIGDAQESAEAAAVLEAVIKATGGSAQVSKDQMIDLADSLQEVTKFESETTQAAEAVLASFRNVKGDVFVEAIKSAQDMSTVLKTDLSGSAMMLGKALNDPVDGMKKLARSGVTFSEAQVKMVEDMVKTGDVAGAQKVILEELSHEFGGAAKAAGATSWAPLKNQLGDIGEEIGARLIPLVSRLLPVAQEIMVYITDTVVPYWEASFKYMGDVAGGFGISFESIWAVIVYAFQAALATIEFIAANAFNAVEAAAYGLGYGLVSIFNETIHMFTSTLPEAISWFADNFGNILTDISNFTITVFSNMWTNIKAFIEGMKNLLSGGGADFKFVALTEGFESTLTDLPQFTERVPTELEAQMQAGLDAALGRIQKDFGKKVAQVSEASMSILAENTKKKVEESKKSFEGLGGGTGHELDVAQEKEKEKEKTAKTAKGGGGGGGMEDIEAMYNRIASSQFKGPSEQEKLDALKDNTAALTDFGGAKGPLAGQSNSVTKKGKSVEELLDQMLVEAKATAINTKATAATSQKLVTAIESMNTGGLA